MLIGVSEELVNKLKIERKESFALKKTLSTFKK